jgi:endonuclease YncB( thermonuclease family)
MLRLLACLLASCAFGLLRPAAAELPAGLRADARVAVTAVLDSDTLRLADGRELRLAAILGAKSSDVGEAARATLERLAAGQTLTLAFTALQSDRYGRVLAHATNEAGAWLQGEMLRAGFARVATSADARAGATEMLALEEEARRARRGLWSQGTWRVREAATLGARDADSFQIVSGTVRSVARVKGRTYLNFGEDWRSDFTVAIAPSALKLCREAGLDPTTLSGKSLRVRGWVKLQNGTLIDLTHPEQLEVLP